MKRELLVLIAIAIVNSHHLPVVEAFQCTQSVHSARVQGFGDCVSNLPLARKTSLFDAPNGDTEEQVEVGTKEYYSGFLSSPIQDETVAERGSGLEQALKLGGGFALVLVVLFVGFMASNGLI